MKKVPLLTLVVAAFFIVGCDDSSQTAAKPTPQPDQLETGRFALQKMLPPARLWSADAMPVRLQSEVLKDTNGHGGKAGFWRALFASSGRQNAEPFTWSGISSEDSPRGVNHGTEDSYNPSNRSLRSFDLNFLKVDTDKAFEVAQEHGGKTLLEKDAKQPVTYLLDWESTGGNLRWHVIYGGSESNSKLTVFVDATTGQYLRKE